MKTVKIIIMFLIFSLSVNAQTTEPVQHSFILNGDATLLSSDLDYFKIDEFIMGWHWGSAKRISQALLMNMADVTTDSKASNSYYGLNHFKDNLHFFVESYYNMNGSVYGTLHTHCYWGSEIMLTNGIQYEPTLFIDPNDRYKLNIREGDSSNPVFGFLKKRGRIINNPSDSNYSRLIIDSTELIGEVILEEPWPNFVLNYIGMNENPE